MRADDDVGQREGVIRERLEQLAIERAGALVRSPALAGRDDLLDAVRCQGGDKCIDVATILGEEIAVKG